MSLHGRGLSAALFALTASGIFSVARADPREFVCKKYEGAVPYERARAFRAYGVVSRLDSILKTETGVCRYNAAMTLGAIGTHDAFKALTEFIKKGDGDLTPSEFDGKSGAVLALGWIANAASNSDPSDQKARAEALEYLRNATTNLDAWKEIRWRAPEALRIKDLPVYLTQRAIQALGLSGSHEAEEDLEKNPLCKRDIFEGSCMDARGFLKSSKAGLAALYPGTTPR